MRVAPTLRRLTLGLLALGTSACSPKDAVACFWCEVDSRPAIPSGDEYVEAGRWWYGELIVEDGEVLEASLGHLDVPSDGAAPQCEGYLHLSDAGPAGDCGPCDEAWVLRIEDVEWEIDGDCTAADDELSAFEGSLGVGFGGEALYIRRADGWTLTEVDELELEENDGELFFGWARQGGL